MSGERLCECHHPGVLSLWPSQAAEDRRASTPLLRLEREPQLTEPIVPRPALVLDALECHYPRPRRHPLAAAPAPRRAVAGVSLSVPAGGSLAIVGESGSGKTTLLRMVVGLLAPTAGSVTLGRGAPPQLIFQDAGASLTPWMPIGAQISERLAALGVPRAERSGRVASTLEAVGLPAEVAAAVPRKLSGGQRQRAAIARAIVVPPALLACDEPVSALDVSLAAQVLNLLCDLRTSLGIALLFVTHDLAAARAVADEVAVMSEGVVVEHGPTEQIFRSPQHPYTRELIAAVPDLAEVA
jgi:peptide/nickel transport system ATP-binding protein